MVKKSFKGFRKGLVTALVTGVMLVLFTVPAFAYYSPSWNYSYDSLKYEGNLVQKTLQTVTMYGWSTGGLVNTPVVMTMGQNELVVGSYNTNYIQGYGTERQVIGGKVGDGMVEGWVNDGYIQVIRDSNSNYNLKTRYALTAYGSSAGTWTNGSDVPGGVRVHPYNGELRAYKDGSLTHIDGYWGSSGFIVKDCYVHTNWQSGSIGSYYIYLY